jgi:hypothetical protein
MLKRLFQLNSTQTLGLGMDVLAWMSVLIAKPWLALVPSAVFAALAAGTKSRTAAVVAVAWLVYCTYEYCMKYRIMCTGECDIRIDLLALYPVLIGASIAGLIAVALSVLRRAGTQAAGQ